LTPHDEAASLGRTHRPKLLPAPQAQKLLARPESDEPHEEAAGIKRLVRRVGLYLPRVDAG
jgi:hypothetical protein